jgi:hypothetical protein
LPLVPQRVRINAVIDEYLERDRSSGDPVRGKPGLGRASSA